MAIVPKAKERWVRNIYSNILKEIKVKELFEFI